MLRVEHRPRGLESCARFHSCAGDSSSRTRTDRFQALGRLDRRRVESRVTIRTYGPILRSFVTAIRDQITRIRTLPSFSYQNQAGGQIANAPVSSPFVRTCDTDTQHPSCSRLVLVLAVTRPITSRPRFNTHCSIVAHGVRFAATLASLSASQRLRQALVDPKSTITHLERLANKVEDVRNINPSTRQTSLALAARAGRLDVCEWLLFDEGHEEIEISRDAAGETILHIAAASGFVDLLNLYLSQYPFVLDWVDARGATPLHIAAMKGQLEAVQILIHARSEIDVRDMFGNTPLHYAASWGSLPVIKLLIELDCDYNATNGEGFIPYEYAYSFDVARAMKEFYEDRILERSRKAERRRARRARIAAPSPSLSGESVAHSDNYAYESSSSMERDPSPIGICLGSTSRSGTGDTLRPAPRQNQSGSSSRRTSQREGPNGSSKRNSATSDLATAFNQVSEVSDSNASRSETPSRLILFGRKEGGSGDGRGLPGSPISPPPVTSLSPTDLSLDGRRSDEGISSASVAPRHRSQSSVFPSQSTLVAKQDGPPIPTRSRTLDPLVPVHTLFTARSDERDSSSSNRMRLGKLTKDPSSGTATSTAMGTELDQTSPVPGVLRSRTTGSVVSSASHGGRASRMAKALGLGLGRK